MRTGSILWGIASADGEDGEETDGATGAGREGLFTGLVPPSTDVLVEVVRVGWPDTETAMPVVELTDVETDPAGTTIPPAGTSWDGVTFNDVDGEAARTVAEVETLPSGALNWLELVTETEPDAVDAEIAMDDEACEPAGTAGTPVDEIPTPA